MSTIPRDLKKERERERESIRLLCAPTNCLFIDFRIGVPQKASTSARGTGKKEARGRGRGKKMRMEESAGERRRAALRTEERVVSSRVPRRAVGSIVLLREVDHSLSLSHAALIAHRSPIVLSGREERKRERTITARWGGRRKGEENRGRTW